MPGAEYDDRVWDQLQHLEAMLIEQRKLLVGNGNIGLCEQVRQNKQQIDAFLKAFSEFREAVVAMQWRALALFAAGALLWLWHVIGGDPAKLPGLVFKWLGG